MKEIVVKVAQNGGEYYGYTTIQSPHAEDIYVEGNILVIDDTRVKFDEYIEIRSIKSK